jgi:uncharacterized protein YjbI with pentapeptide repeats
MPKKPQTNIKLQLKRMKWLLRKMQKNAFPFFRRALSILVSITAIAILAIIIAWAIQPDTAPIWTGFGTQYPNTPSAKTLWDWMELLIVPVVLALAAIWFNQKMRNNDSKIAEERLREEILQDYFDRMSDLLLKQNLYKADKNDDVRFIARARTLSIFRQLDGNRKGIVLGFLHSVRLIQCKQNDKWEIIEFPVIGLIGADLSGLSVSMLGGNLSSAYLDNLFLQDTDLEKANLYHADLSGSSLVSVWLIGANLENAKLNGANLQLAFLVDANLKDADFSGANLTNTIVTAEQLSQAKSLENCIMPNGILFDPNRSLEEQCKLELSGEQV